MQMLASLILLFRRTGNVAVCDALENCKEKIGGMIHDINVAKVV